MFYGPIFDYFDPKEGEVPDHFDAEFDRVAVRSRSILADWSKADIIDAGEAIDELVRHTREAWLESTLEKLEQPTEAEEDGNAEVESEPKDGPADELEWCMGRIDPGAVLESGPVQWSALFAVQALALIAHGLEEQAHLEALSKRDKTGDRNVGSFAVDAMEALAKAEVLIRVEELEQDFEAKVRRAVADRTSGQAAHAAKHRHAPQNHVKKRFITWFLENHDSGVFKSRSQAAEKFYRELDADERRLFQPTNATRTLLGALREYLRDSPAEPS